jgi:hypothetical protein
MLSLKYNQRTKSWDSKIIKKVKDYAYVTLMIAKVLDSKAYSGAVNRLKSPKIALNRGLKLSNLS